MDEDIALPHLFDKELAGNLPETPERIVVSIEERVHVGDRMNAVATVALPRRLPDNIDGLIANLTALQEVLLNEGAIVEVGAALVGTPLGNAFIIWLFAYSCG
jgi:hypothetical protein